MASNNKQRSRKANYSQDENLFLAEKYEEHKDALDAKHKDSNTNKKKKEIWASIYSQHSARYPDVQRSLDDLKNRLTKLKSESRECLSNIKKGQRATGGGKPPKQPNPAQQKILDLCEDTPGFKGLQGVESSASKAKTEDDDFSVRADSEDEYDEEWSQSGSGPSTSKSETFSQAHQAAKKQKMESFHDLVDIERENALLKRDNLQLKQEKLKLQIELLKRQLKEPETVHCGDGRQLFKL